MAEAGYGSRAGIGPTPKGRAVSPARKIAGLGAAVLLCAPGCPAAPPEPGAAPQEPPLSGAAVQKRLDFITERLDRHRAHAAAWQYGWTTVFLGNIGANAIALRDNPESEEQVDRGVSIAKAGLGLYRTLARPHPGRFGAAPLAPNAAPPGTGPRERLARAEVLLAATARRAGQRYQKARHLGILGVNVLGGAIIWAFGNPRDALRSTVTGILGGELRLWSQPWQPAADYAEYGNRFSRPPAQATWRVLPTPRGARLQIRY
jgi:hypothetical protein